MYPLVLGPVAASVGLGPLEAALVAAQGSVSGPAWAATRLLGIDPYAVGSCLADLAPAVEQVAHDAGALYKLAKPGRRYCRATQRRGGPSRDRGRSPCRMGGASLCLLKPTFIPTAFASDRP